MQASCTYRGAELSPLRPTNENQRHVNAQPTAVVQRALQRSAWFSALPTPLQEVVVRRSTIRTFRRGESIQREGERPREMGFVLSGRVRCLIRCGTERETVAHVGGPGFWFGSAAMFPNASAFMSVVADAPTQTMLLPRAEFERIIEEEPRHFRPFSTLAFELLAQLIRYLGELPGLTLDGVLRVRIADMAERARREGGLDGPVQLVLSQADLASMVGMSRQRLNQRLRALQDEGLVELGFRRIIVPDPARLRGSAGVDAYADAHLGAAARRAAAPLRRQADR
jgi:CRP/FNR family transcriptional regulator, cyclic AMP receptor protein